jgi:hypothetical protein
VLVATVLVNVPIRPPLKLAIGLLVIVGSSALFAVLLSNALLRSPSILFGVAAVVTFRALYSVAQGRPRLPSLMLLLCITTIPIVALDSASIAGEFAFSLVRATALAVVIVWISHLLWPCVKPPQAAAAVAPLPREMQLKSALLGTAILAPLMLVYLLFGFTSALPVIVGTMMIVINLDFGRSRLQAVALVVGNIAGGVIALLLVLLLAMEPSLVSLILLTALTALVFGWRISHGDPLAPVFLVACNATLIVFTSSLLSDQGTFDVWLTRLLHFVIAGAFSIGMMTLMWPVKDQSIAPAPTTT